MKYFNVKITALLLAMIVAGACSNRIERKVAEINLLLDSLKSEYAPDTRVALWDIEVTGSKDIISLSGEVDNKSSYMAIVTAVKEKFPEVKNTLTLLPEGGDREMVNGLVNNSVANFRAEPSSRSELVTQALLGTPVRILKAENGRYLVQTPNRYLGWVNDSEVQSMDQTELARFRDAPKIIFNRQYGFAYSEPDETSMPVSDLVIGCLLPVISSESKFYKVQYPDGRLAWVKKVETVPAEQVFNQTTTKEGVVSGLMEFNGIPYLWGGASSKAIDCSGLSCNVFFMNGTLLPRDADQQSFCGTEVTTNYNYEELVAGDLLFFGRKATDTQPESITHVTIYIGDSEFIHAAGYRDRVSINSMDSTRENYIPSYPDIYIRTVRVIGEQHRGFESITENEFYQEIIGSTK